MRQSESSGLVRQQAPGRPVPVAPVVRQTQRTQGDDGFRSFGQPSGDSTPAKAQPRVWEAQGSPEPERSAPVQPANRSAQPVQQRSNALVGPVAPVQQGNAQQQKDEEQKYSAWHQGQKPATASGHSQPSSHTTAQTHESSPKKGH